MARCWAWPFVALVIVFKSNKRRGESRANCNSNNVGKSLAGSFLKMSSRQKKIEQPNTVNNKIVGSIQTGLHPSLTVMAEKNNPFWWDSWVWTQNLTCCNYRFACLKETKVVVGIVSWLSVANELVGLNCSTRRGEYLMLVGHCGTFHGALHCATTENVPVKLEMTVAEPFRCPTEPPRK